MLIHEGPYHKFARICFGAVSAIGLLISFWAQVVSLVGLDPRAFFPKIWIVEPVLTLVLFPLSSHRLPEWRENAIRSTSPAPGPPDSLHVVGLLRAALLLVSVSSVNRPQNLTGVADVFSRLAFNLCVGSFVLRKAHAPRSFEKQIRQCRPLVRGAPLTVRLFRERECGGRK